MSRQLLSADDLDPLQRELREQLVSGPRAGFLAGYVPEPGDWPLPGPFGPMLLSPAVGGALQELGAALRYRSDLPADVREIAVVATAAGCDSTYELEHHVPLAREAGVPEGVIGQVLAGGTAIEDRRLGAAVALSRSLVLGASPDVLALRTLEEDLGAAATFELLVVAGYYRLLATVLAAYEIS